MKTLITALLLTAIAVPSLAQETFTSQEEFSAQVLVQKSKDPIVPHPSVALQGYQKKLYVAYFYTATCGPCKIMGPRMDQLRKRGWKVYKFNMLYHKNATRLLNKEGIAPTMVIMNQGRPVQLLRGKVDLKELERRLNIEKRGPQDEEEEDEDDGLDPDMDESGLRKKIRDYDLF